MPVFVQLLDIRQLFERRRKIKHIKITTTHTHQYKAVWSTVCAPSRSSPSRSSSAVFRAGNGRAMLLGHFDRLLEVFDREVGAHDRLFVRGQRLPDAHQRSVRSHRNAGLPDIRVWRAEGETVHALVELNHVIGVVADDLEVVSGHLWISACGEPLHHRGHRVANVRSPPRPTQPGLSIIASVGADEDLPEPVRGGSFREPKPPRSCCHPSARRCTSCMYRRSR